MVAKFNSKTHLQNTLFVLLSHFVRVWLQSLQKVKCNPKNFMFQKCDLGIKKRRIWCWFRICRKSCKIFVCLY